MHTWIRRFPPALAALFALAGCASVVREHIYRANPTPVTVSQWTRTPPRTVSVTTQDGLTLSGYYWPGATDDRDVIIFFHGRGSHQGVGAKYAEYLTGYGDHVIVASYRGFGGNPGKPTQAGLVADGRAFVLAARALAGPDARIFLVGHSLGGAVALHVAATVPVNGVVTLSTFDRFEDSAPAGMGMMLPDKWNNLDAVTKIRTPFVMTQGTEDDRVDLDQAQALFSRASSPAAMITVPGAGHNPQMDRLAPLVTQAVEAIDAGDMAHYPAALPDDMNVQRK